MFDWLKKWFRPSQARGKSLYVGNLPISVTARDLRRLFAPYGTVTDARLPVHPTLKIGHSLGFGFVTMLDGAEAAIAALHGTSFQGRELTVNEAAPYKEPPRDQFAEILERHTAHLAQPESTGFRAVVYDLRELAVAGHVEAAHELAEILARPGPYYDPESAYKWYYIALSQQGYTVQFEDHNDMPPAYCGPVGDFRNEAGVSQLVDQLGFDKVRSLDAEAARWLAERHPTND